MQSGVLKMVKDLRTFLNDVQKVMPNYIARVKKEVDPARMDVSGYSPKT